ncbi:hypothetical protein OHAE_5295 [Ochrobactrum soli]|uniref:Uncharacterized protein n=1 Tax=Ochrobactrum soli TaxID=2448455 RepID=A0A2P9HF11_9HYPH|nr:hypothetical protein OHAE_5295 [[Ochrobactrum] soli]
MEITCIDGILSNVARFSLFGKIIDLLSGLNVQFAFDLLAFSGTFGTAVGRWYWWHFSMV